jgi:predicted metal-dependent HD superfamily phosphohydrolase
MNYQGLLKKVSEYAVQFFLEHPHEHFYYHNLTHTVRTLDAVNKINSLYQLDEKNYFIVCTAVWFHDTGILLEGLADHEAKSAEIAEAFLTKNEVSAEEITEIKKCILATKLPQSPHSLVEKIVCDADLFNLGTPDFGEINKLVKKEVEAQTHVNISGYDWRAKTISLLENHHYHTEYCQTHLNKTKAENLEHLKRKQEEKSF